VPAFRRFLVISLLLGLLLPVVSSAADEPPISGSGSYRISASLDDAESDVSEPKDTEYEPTSSDLEIPLEGGEFQVVGLRYPQIEIPKNVLITSASVTFVIDSAPQPSMQTNFQPYNLPIDIIIDAENLESPRNAFGPSAGQ
jgi:hypothetical protein